MENDRWNGLTFAETRGPAKKASRWPKASLHAGGKARHQINQPFGNERRPPSKRISTYLPSKTYRWLMRECLNRFFESDWIVHSGAIGPALWEQSSSEPKFIDGFKILLWVWGSSMGLKPFDGVWNPSIALKFFDGFEIFRSVWSLKSNRWTVFVLLTLSNEAV